MPQSRLVQPANFNLAQPLPLSNPYPAAHQQKP
jgi:hypothetical protein